MRLIEADAKRFLAESGLPVPGGRVVLEADAILPAGSSDIAVKAQILAGGRGKGGLVRLAKRAEAASVIEAVRLAMRDGGHAPFVMIEDQVQIAEEYYLAWRVDDVRRAPVLMFSLHGGVEVEDHADEMRECVLDAMRQPRLSEIAAFLATCGLRGRKLAAVARFAIDLHGVFVREDAVLIEINPLILTPRDAAVAVDAKITLDENSARRHLSWHDLLSRRMETESNDEIESEAARAGFTFVRLEGEVALMTGGAGVGMTLVDLLADAGMSAANFVDLPGGSSAAMFGDLARLVLRRTEDTQVRAMLIFLTLSATSLKQPVESILSALDAAGSALPIVVGLVAGGSAEREMTLEQARSEFQRRGYVCVDDLDAAVTAVARALKR